MFLELVRKRHDGDGWIVFSELANMPGFGPKRYADAVAIGVWQSLKFEAHLYEFKVSREDVKRELRNPAKADGVGKYCHYWWLVIDDVKRISDLVIPEVWGILIVKKHGDGKRLVVHRKAPKLKPKAFDAHFSVMAIRNIRDQYIDPTKHIALKEELELLKNGPVDTDGLDLQGKIDSLERENRRTKEMIERFEKAAGISLGEPSWEWGSIGEAVAVVKKIRDHHMARGDIHDDVHRLSKAAEEMEARAAELAESAVLLRSLMASTEHAENCATKRRWSGRCSCGIEPLSKVEQSLVEVISNGANGHAEDVRAGCDT